MALEEQVPALRFVLWLDQRLGEYDHVAHLHDKTPIERLASDLGLTPNGGERILWRWRGQLKAGSIQIAGQTIKCDRFSGTFPRASVEQALFEFGADFYEVYPQLAHEREVGELYERWCKRCRENVTTGHDALCPWCESKTGRAYHGRKPGRPLGKYRRIPDDDLRALHRLYWAQGLSVRQLAEDVWERYGYKSVRSCTGALHDGFKGLYLQLRTQREATIRRNWKHGRGRRGRDEHEYRTFMKEQRGWNSLHGPGRPDCKATKTDGERCTKHALADSDYCVGHDPRRKLFYQAQLARMRATHAHNNAPLPFEPFAQLLERLHAEHGPDLAALKLGCSRTTLYNMLNRLMSSPGGRRPRTEIGRQTVDKYLTRLGLDFEDVYGEQELAA